MNSTELQPHPLDDEAEGGIAWNPASPYVKEMCKWEQFPTEWTIKRKPGNPYVFREFPKMLYRAQRQHNGQYACMPPPPHPYDFATQVEYDRAVLAWEAFCRSCYRIVDDESADRLAQGQGWATDPQKAMEIHEKHQQAIGNASAEMLAAADRMSERARRELEEAGASTHQHVTDVKGRKRGRKPKAVVAVEEEA